LSALFLDKTFQYAFIDAVRGKSVRDIGQGLVHEVEKATLELVAESEQKTLKWINDQKEHLLRVYEACRKHHFGPGESPVDPREEYRKELKSHNVEQERRKQRLREDPKYGLSPKGDFTSYEKWRLEGADYGSWPVESKRLQENLRDWQTRFKCAGAHIDFLRTHKVDPVLPPEPEINLCFECGYDIQFHVFWSCTGPKVPVLTSEGPCGHKLVESTANRKARVERKIEIKPQLGDDFPGVLRQMKNSKADTLVIGSFDARGCGIEDVRQIFASSECKIIILSDIQVIKERLLIPDLEPL
jgi:hypothetical protein